MTTSKNLLTPSSWDPIVTPSQDMILGSYYLTVLDKEDKRWEWMYFDSIIDAEQAYDAWAIDFRTPIKVRINWNLEETTYWRLLFNEIIPEELWFQNTVFNKWALKKILARSFEELWDEVTAQFVNEIKNFGYKYATFSGLTISKDDMVTPKEQKKLLEEGEEKVKYIQKQRWLWFLTEDEKYNQSIAIWAQVKKEIEKYLKKEFNYKNHIFNFVDSWARWNWWNITQLCWMKWLVASPSGKTIELPIKSTLKEGFSTLEYFIATHGWRKWKSDTALKTAQSGYLTRRLVDSSQNIIVREEDCKTIHYKEVNRNDVAWGSFAESFGDKIYGRTLATDLYDNDGNLIAPALTVIDKKLFDKIEELQIEKVNVRSILTCNAEWWACQKCYWLDLWLNKEVEIGTPVWVIAAQSIWEPGTQLTMRTFHSGWVAKEGWDMTQGLARVEELFEARIPHKSLAEIAEIDWQVNIEHTDKDIQVIIKAPDLKEDEYFFDDSFEVKVKVGQEIKAKQILARDPDSTKNKIVSNFPWIVEKIEKNKIVIKDKTPRVVEYSIPFGKDILVKDGDNVKAWTKLTEWNIDLHKLTEVAWIFEAQKYIVEEIKSIYSSQWQTVNSKHIELIIRQMFSRVRILEKWDSSFFPWDIIDVIAYNRENEKLIKEGKKQAIWERLLLWITKISLHTESWLSAASFQETVRVLVEASTSWKIDRLEELKENVIIGRLIPAWKQFRIKMWLEKPDDDENNYFDSRADNIDVSESHLEEVMKNMADDSDF
jgi:DNA-directed RNA polymerase subunit beta'